MQLAEELVTHAVGQQVLQWLETARLDYAALARQQAVRILAEIQAVIQDEVIDDYTRVDIFLRYEIDSGTCHMV